jgi:hypothetical protein
LLLAPFSRVLSKSLHLRKAVVWAAKSLIVVRDKTLLLVLVSKENDQGDDSLRGEEEDIEREGDQQVELEQEGEDEEEHRTRGKIKGKNMTSAETD